MSYTIIALLALIDLFEVSLGFGQVVSLDSIIISLGLASVFTSLVHHEDSVITCSYGRDSPLRLRS